MSINSQDVYPTEIVTYEAEETLVKTATAKDDFGLLSAIKDVWLQIQNVMSKVMSKVFAV